MSKVKKELNRFLLAGLSAVATDLITYYMLLNFLNINIAKATSFLLGTIIAFLINKYWTFEKQTQNPSEVWKFSLLYLTTLGVNILVNQSILNISASVFLAFLIATSVSAMLNFIGQKFWVFK